MKYVIIEKKDADRYVLYDAENKGMCCVSKYTLQQLRDDKHQIIGLNSTTGSVKAGDITIMTLDGKVRTKNVTYEVANTKRSAATVEKGIKLPNKHETDVYLLEFVIVNRVSMDWDGDLKKINPEFTSKIKKYALSIGNNSYYLEDDSIYVDVPGTRKKTKQMVKKIPINNKQIGNILRKSYSSHLKIDQIMEQIEKLKEQRYVAYSICAETSNAILKVLGYLKTDEFIDEFKSNLSSMVRGAIEDYKYIISINRKMDNTYTIDIARDEDIIKYFRSASFIYEEYDGTIFLADDYEHDKEYQSYLNRYKETLPIKKKPDELYLSVGGDKDCLSCHTIYHLNVMELTQNTARKLAIEFCK